MSDNEYTAFVLVFHDYFEIIAKLLQFNFSIFTLAFKYSRQFIY